VRAGALAAFVAGILVLGAGLPAVEARAAEGGCRVEAETFRARGAFTALRSHLRRGEPVRVLAIGSSSTEGVGASTPRASYPARLEAQLRDRWPVEAEVDNAGVAGEVASATVGRLETLLAEDRPDVVIWQVGTNDAVRGEGEDRFRALVERGVAAAARAGVDLVLVDQQYFPTINDSARYERYVRIVEEVGTRLGVSVFSRYALMRGWAERSPEEIRAALAPDGFHMSDRGYACLAGLLAESLDRAGRGGTPPRVTQARAEPPAP
jgi:lysophospholipase L1-like esterase